MSRGITNDEFFQQHMVQSRPLNIAEAARIMRRGEREVRALMASGVLPYIKRGKGRYLLIEDIRYVLRQEAEAAKVVQERKTRNRRAIDTSGLSPLLRRRSTLF